MNYNYTLKDLYFQRKQVLQENEAKYTFEVSVKASKEDIKKAVEATFGLKVEQLELLSAEASTKDATTYWTEENYKTSFCSFKRQKENSYTRRSLG